MKYAKKLLPVAALLSTVAARAYDPPTMGWSSWNTYRVEISDELICRQARALVELGLAGAGYVYVNIDDGFFGGRDADGNLLVHSERFPEGLQPVVDYIHALGLKAGIYSDAGRSTCGCYWDRDAMGRGSGLYGHDERDAGFFFSRLGFDFIKIDFCGGDSAQNDDGLDLDERTRYTAIRQAIDRTGRDVRVNLCRWAFPGTWAGDVASSWRIAADIRPDWESVARIIAANRYLSAYATGGRFNDMDMLEIGRGLSPAEERTHFGMWCMLSSPLLIGCDLTHIPPSSLSLLTNDELIALDRDPLALQARIVHVEQGVYLYAKDLETVCSLDRAVAVYNPTDRPQRFSVRMPDVELAGTVRVRDLFAREDLPPVVQGVMEVCVEPHDTRIFRLRGERRLERTLYEAETAWLERYQELGLNRSLGYAGYAEDTACSGGAKAEWLGAHPDNWLEWRDVYAPEGGEYEMTVRYEPRGEDGFAQCSVNGGPSVRLELPGRETPAERFAQRTLRIALRRGRNVVRLSNAEAWIPDIDCMRLKRIAPAAGAR